MSLALIAIIAAVWLSQAADVWTTHRALDLGGREDNPRMRWVMERAGFAGFVAVKAAVAAAVTALLLYWPHWAAFLMAGVLSALTFKVAIENLSYIKTLD